MPQTLPERIGIAGLYCFALFAVAGISGANIGLALMTLGLLLQLPTFWRRTHSSPVVWLILACLAYAAISAAAAGSALPDTVEHQIDQLNKWGQLILVIVVAWWLKDGPRRFHVALLLFATGAIIRMGIYFPWEHTRAVLQQFHFGLARISYSAYFSAIAMAVALFAPRLLRKYNQAYLRITIVALLLLATEITIEGILLGQSRGTWLAIIVTFPPLLFLYLRGQSSHHIIPRRYVTLGIAIALVLTSTTLAFQKELLLGRVFAEQKTWQAMSQGDFDSVPQTSIGIRIHLYQIGITRWLEKPWFGWGTGSEDHIMELAGYRRGDYMPPHVHNIVLEALMRFGIVGFTLGTLVVWIVYRNLWILYRGGQLPPDWYYFLIGMLVFNLVWGMFDIRIMRWDYRDYFLLLFGAALALGPPFREQRMLDKLSPSA